jgi:hypothetical protein
MLQKIKVLSEDFNEVIISYLIFYFFLLNERIATFILKKPKHVFYRHIIYKS